VVQSLAGLEPTGANDLSQAALWTRGKTRILLVLGPGYPERLARDVLREMQQPRVAIPVRNEQRDVVPNALVQQTAYLARLVLEWSRKGANGRQIIVREPGLRDRLEQFAPEQGRCECAASPEKTISLPTGPRRPILPGTPWPQVAPEPVFL
jgi:hypothetical protein